MIFLYKIFNRFPHFIQNIIQKIFNYFFRKKSWTVIHTTKDNITYELDLWEWIDNNIYYLWCFEPNTYNAIKKLLKKDMTVIDIGANIWAHTFIMAKIVWNNGKVIAFEPMKWAFKKLKKNYDLNTFNNITLENSWLSNKNAKLHWKFTFSWRIDWKKKISNEQELQFQTLDEYITNNHIKSVDFIKLDVDWYEYKVLQWAQETLKKHKPIIVLELWEYTLSGCGDKIEDLLDLLYQIWYEFYAEENFVKFKNKHSLLHKIPVNWTINAIASIAFIK